jgi:hypothetical protein
MRDDQVFTCPYFLGTPGDMTYVGSHFKLSADQRDVTSASTRPQALKENLKQSVLEPCEIECSFDDFPYYLRCCLHLINHTIV